MSAQTGSSTDGLQVQMESMSWCVFDDKVKKAALLKNFISPTKLQDPQGNTIACMHPIRATRFHLGMVHYEFYFYRPSNGGAVSNQSHRKNLTSSRTKSHSCSSFRRSWTSQSFRPCFIDTAWRTVFKTSLIET